MNSICQNICDVLGGVNRLRVMLGCNIMVDESTNSVVLSEIKSKKANTVKITLNKHDLYDVKMLKINYAKYTIKDVGVWEDVYVEDLKELIEDRIEMYLSI